MKYNYLLNAIHSTEKNIRRHLQDMHHAAMDAGNAKERKDGLATLDHIKDYFRSKNDMAQSLQELTSLQKQFAEVLEKAVEEKLTPKSKKKKIEIEPHAETKHHSASSSIKSTSSDRTHATKKSAQKESPKAKPSTFGYGSKWHAKESTTINRPIYALHAPKKRLS